MKIYGIYSEGYKSSINDLVEKGRYDAVPAVFISDGEHHQSIFYDKPFNIFEKNMELDLLKSIVSQYEKDIKFLQTPEKAYRKLTEIVNKNLEKIIADMISTQIVLKIKENPDEEIVFFVSNLKSDKIIGRLGYLFLDYSNVTIAFITYKSRELLTNIINKNHLDFDLNFVFGEDSSFGNVNPDNYIQSMLSTFFYNIPLRTDKKISPLRVDIFSQNLSIEDILKKKKTIEKYLTNSNNLSEPIKDNDTEDYVIRIPKPLQFAIDANEHFKHTAEDIINKRRTI